MDRSRLGLFGLSEGSAIALMAAARQPDRVKFLVLGSPPGLQGTESLWDQLERNLASSGLAGAAADVAREAFQQFVSLSRQASSSEAARAELTAFLSGPGATLIPPYRFVPEDAAGRAAFFSSPWYRSQLEWDPEPFLSKVTAPVLVIGGALDPVLPPATHHPALAAGLGGTDGRFEVVPGVNHLLLPARTGSPAEYRALDRSADHRVLALIVRWLTSNGVLREGGAQRE